MSLVSKFQAVCDSYANTVCLLQGERSLTYRELMEHATQWSDAFREAGIQKGDFLSLRASSSIEFVIGLIACTLSRVVLLPISSEVPELEFKETVSHAGCKYVLDLSKVSLTDSWKLSLHEGTILKKRKHYREQLPEEMIAGGFVRYSSGTTGAAKGVCISQSRAFGRVQAVQKIGLVTHGDRILVLLPLPYHFVVSLFLFLLEASTIVIPEKGDLQSQIDAVHDHVVTTMYAAPFQLDLLADRIQENHQLRHVLSTSMPLSEATAERFSKLTRVQIIQLLGNIETGLPFVNKRLAAVEPTLLGDPLPDFSIRLCDEEGEQVAQGVEGVVHMKGPGFFDCYLEPYRSARDVCDEGWFTTGDVLRQDSHGAYQFCGRISRAVNIAGHKVFPEEVEDSLMSISAVSLARVFSKPHTLFGHVLFAEVVFNEGEEELSSAQLKRELRTKLASYKVPSVIQVVESLPLTSTGKVQSGSSEDVTA